MVAVVMLELGWLKAYTKRLSAGEALAIGGDT